MTRCNFVSETQSLNRIALLITVLVTAGSLAFAATGPSNVTPDAGATGLTAGSGSLLVAGTKTPFLPRGFNSVGLLYPSQYASTMCTKLDSTTQRALAAAQAAMTAPPLPGLTYNASLRAMLNDWKANVVRFQVSQGALVFEHENHLKAYTEMVRSAIAQARSAGLVVIVSMQTEGFSCSPLLSNGKLQKLPDHRTEVAWAQLLDAKLTADKGIVLEVFNEPKTQLACGTSTQENWTDWATGCGAGAGAGAGADEGMVTVGRYVRKLAPHNVLLFDGDSNGGVLTGFRVPSGMPPNSAYVEHPYYYVYDSDGHPDKTKSESNWNTRFGDLQASAHTVVVTEWNESANCPNDPGQSITDELVRTYLPDHHMGLLVHSWDAPGGGKLVNGSTYSPIDSNSRCSITGASLVQHQFLTEAGDH